MSLMETTNDLEREVLKDSMPVTVPTSNLKQFTVHEGSATPTKLTQSQGIARDTTKLTWREAEAMAKGIEAKQKEGATLVQAIQAWAWEWKTFREEEQPGS